MYKHRYSSTIPNSLKLERAQMLIGRINYGKFMHRILYNHEIA